MNDNLSPTVPLTLVERVLALREVGAFRAVPAEHLAHLAAAARERSLDAGAELFHEGDAPGSLWILLDGEVRLEHRGAEVATFRPVEPIGAWSLFGDRPRRTTARAAAPSRLLELEREAFYEALAERVEIAHALLSDLVSRLQALAESGSEETPA